MWSSVCRSSRTLCFLLLALCLATTSHAQQTAVEWSGLERIGPESAAKDPDGQKLWYDARSLTLEGKGWADTDKPFGRLPAKAHGIVRDPVWDLGAHSAGMCIRFVTDADQISARWKLTADTLAMVHMPATGVSGLDLYVRDGAQWRWIGVGQPTANPADAVLAQGIPKGVHEFMIYLPLYNGTDSLKIGLPMSASLAKAALRPKPMVFYGTSIVHGGCASRPGMAYPAILGRRLDRSVVNLGFSGNGPLDPELGVLLAELDASVYVLDCAPNMNPTLIAERTESFVKALRKARPDTPIVIVENIRYQAGAFLPGSRQSYEDKNNALRTAYEKLEADGVAGLHYVTCDALLGDDGEATVDGTHPNDLGFMRMADALEPALRAALGQE